MIFATRSEANGGVIGDEDQGRDTELGRLEANGH